jgi:hypothetical protein
MAGQWKEMVRLRFKEEIDIQVAGKPPTRFSARTRQSLTTFCEPSHSDQAEVTGEVLEADVKQGHFQLWTSDRNHVPLDFAEPEEDQVTAALKDHRAVRMRVKGRGEVSPQGKLLRITEVQNLGMQPAGKDTFDQSARPIEDILEELASEIPQSEWDRLPSDLSDNLDHYLYGTPKR